MKRTPAIVREYSILVGAYGADRSRAAARKPVLAHHYAEWTQESDPVLFSYHHLHMPPLGGLRQHRTWDLPVLQCLYNLSYLLPVGELRLAEEVSQSFDVVVANIRYALGDRTFKGRHVLRLRQDLLAVQAGQ